MGVVLAVKAVAGVLYYNKTFMKLFFSKIFFFFLKETNWILLVVAQGTLCAVFPSHALISLFSQRNSTASEAQDTETL